MKSKVKEVRMMAMVAAVLTNVCLVIMCAKGESIDVSLVVLCAIANLACHFMSLSFL